MNWRTTPNNGKERYWQSRELIVIGTFAALTKVSTLLIALAGGGMNPVSLVLKNMVATSLLIILVYKVRKFGVLTLFVLVNTVVSLLLMGGSMMTIPGILAASVLCDGLIIGLGGYRKAWALMSGVAAFDLLSRRLSGGIGNWGILYEGTETCWDYQAVNTLSKTTTRSGNSMYGRKW